MSTPDFGALLCGHRKYFQSGATRSAKWREEQLIALRAMMKDHAEEFYGALWTDLRRNRIDSDWTDVKYISSEANHAIAQLRRWMKPLPVNTPLVLTPSRTLVRFDPLGVGLIIGAWNYPVMLTLSPLIAAISGGNAAVIKPSELAAATADVIARRLPEYLDRGAFSVVLGAVRETTALLELGGKNPTIVHSSADLRVAARRIAQGRCSNAGQTCTAPDYVLVFKDVAKPFLAHLKEAMLRFYGNDPQKSPDYGRIVSDRHFARLVDLLASGTIYHGGQHDRADRFVAPTVLINVSTNSPVMQEEIFGPILPILEVGNVKEVIDFVNARPSPLGLYVFAEDQSVTEQILGSTASGDAAVNDCAVQPIIHDLPFGGVGGSGMGKYHGESGFRAYTNARGVLYHSTRIDLGVRYPPYDRNKMLRAMVVRS